MLEYKNFKSKKCILWHSVEGWILPHCRHTSKVHCVHLTRRRKYLGILLPSNVIEIRSDIEAVFHLMIAPIPELNFRRNVRKIRISFGSTRYFFIPHKPWFTCTILHHEDTGSIPALCYFIFGAWIRTWSVMFWYYGSCPWCIDDETPFFWLSTYCEPVSELRLCVSFQLWE
jgi:hypothetical protein